MSLQIASINSGSNGNCYYVGNDEDAILVDVGIAARTIEKRMKNIGLNIKTVKAIFVSHEHTDHIKGLATLAHRHFIPIYITEKTAKNIYLIKHLSKVFTANEPIQIGSLQVMAFTKNHDAADPHSFTITNGITTVGVYTDIGIVCENLINHFRQCHAAFLESNYDDKMLDEGSYPFHLKQRIRGNEGHLSNAQALNLFIKHRSQNLLLLILSHLSKENNSPQIVRELFEQHTTNTKIEIADRHTASSVFTVSSSNFTDKKEASKKVQLQLF